MNKTIMKFTALSACLDPLKLLYVLLLGFVMPIGMKYASLLHGVSDSQTFEMLTGKVGVAFVLMVLCLGLAGNSTTQSGRGGEYLPLIFSRPISKSEYVISKWVVITLIGGSIGALQNLIISMIGINFGEAITAQALFCMLIERFFDAALISAAMILTMLYKHPMFQIAAILSFYIWLSGQTIPPITIASTTGGGAVELSVSATKVMINLSQLVGNMVLPTLNLYDLAYASSIEFVPILSYFAALSVYLFLSVTATNQREFSMEPIEERTSATIPKILVYSAMFFVIARLTAFGYDTHFKSKIDSNKPEIAWIDLTAKLSKKLNTIEKTSSKNSPKDSESSVLCPKCQSMAKENSTEAESRQDISYDLCHHLKEIIELDKQKNKVIILEFFAKNSDPCMRMEKTALSNSQVVDLVEKNFSPVRVSYTPNKSKLLTKTLIDFRRHYRVCAFPTLVVVDSTGKEITNLVGNCSSLSTYKFLSRTVARVKAMGNNSKTNLAFSSRNYKVTQP